MRQIEGYFMQLAMLWGANFLYSLSSISFYGYNVNEILSFAILILLLTHVVVERPRWQLLVPYVLLSYIIYSDLHGKFTSPPSSPPSYGYLFLFIYNLLIWFGCFVVCIFPVIPLPFLPKGNYNVAVKHFTHVASSSASPLPPFVSPHFDELFRTATNDFTDEFNSSPLTYPVTIFFPIDNEKKKGPLAPYCDQRVLKAISKYISLPSFVFSHLSLATLSAYSDGTISNEKKFPVILFSHGRGGVPSVYSVFAQSLASQGYVVILPAHCDKSASVVHFPSPSHFEDVVYKPIQDDSQYVTNDNFRNSSQRSRQLVRRCRELNQLLFDVIGIESKSNNNNPNDNDGSFTSFLRGHIDTNHITLMGHSFGAATVLQSSLSHLPSSPISQIILLDPWTEPLQSAVIRGDSNGKSVGNKKFHALIVISEAWKDIMKTNGKEISSYLQTNKNIFSSLLYIYLTETKHSNFSDLALYSQFVAKRMGMVGKCDFKKCCQFVNEISLKWIKTEGNETEKETSTRQWIDNYNKKVEKDRSGGHPLVKFMEE